MILSGVMMFQHLGWSEAAAPTTTGNEASIAMHAVTFDFARLMKAEGIKDLQGVKCSESADAIIASM